MMLVVFVLLKQKKKKSYYIILVVASFFGFSPINIVWMHNLSFVWDKFLRIGLQCNIVIFNIIERSLSRSALWMDSVGVNVM